MNDAIPFIGFASLITTFIFAVRMSGRRKRKQHGTNWLWFAVSLGVLCFSASKTETTSPKQSITADASSGNNSADFPSAPTEAPADDMNLKTIGTSPNAVDGNHNWACPATKAQFDAMTDALVKSDNEGYQESVADGVALEPGTKVRILEHAGPLGTVVKLRVLSGTDEGRSCWASADAAGMFKEGYP